MVLGSGPFRTGNTSFTGGIGTSIATANLTEALDGTTLDCADGSFGSSTPRSIVLTLKGMRIIENYTLRT